MLEACQTHEHAFSRRLNKTFVCCRTLPSRSDLEGRAGPAAQLDMTALGQSMKYLNVDKTNVTANMFGTSQTYPIVTSQTLNGTSHYVCD